MDWIPIVFVIFKFLVLGTGMFYAIKWHYDQQKKGREMRAVLRASAKAAAVFMLLLLSLGLLTYVVVSMLGMDLNYP